MGKTLPTILQIILVTQNKTIKKKEEEEEEYLAPSTKFLLPYITSFCLIYPPTNTRNTNTVFVPLYTKAA